MMFFGGVAKEHGDANTPIFESTFDFFWVISIYSLRFGGSAQ